MLLVVLRHQTVLYFCFHREEERASYGSLCFCKYLFLPTSNTFQSLSSVPFLFSSNFSFSIIIWAGIFVLSVDSTPSSLNWASNLSSNLCAMCSVKASWHLVIILFLIYYTISLNFFSSISLVPSSGGPFVGYTLDESVWSPWDTLQGKFIIDDNNGLYNVI